MLGAALALALVLARVGTGTVSSAHVDWMEEKLLVLKEKKGLLKVVNL